MRSTTVNQFERWEKKTYTDVHALSGRRTLAQNWCCNFSILVLSSAIYSIDDIDKCIFVYKFFTYQSSSVVKEHSKLVLKVAPLFRKKLSVFKVATATSSPTFWAVTCSTVRLEMVNDKTWLPPKNFCRKHCIRVHSSQWSTYGFYARASQTPRAGCWLPIKGTYTIYPLCHFVCNTSKRSLVRISSWYFQFLCQSSLIHQFFRLHFIMNSIKLFLALFACVSMSEALFFDGGVVTITGGGALLATLLGFKAAAIGGFALGRALRGSRRRSYHRR